QQMLGTITDYGAQYIETREAEMWRRRGEMVPGSGGSQFPPLIIGGGPGGGGGPLPSPYTPGVAGGRLPSPSAGARGGNVNVSLVVNGANEEVVIREVVSSVREAWRRMGA